MAFIPDGTAECHSIFWDIDPFFDSKIYVFRLKNGSVTSIIGSPNLIGPALSTNVETNVEIQDFDEPERLYEKLFEAAEKNGATIEKRLKKWAKVNSRVNQSEKARV